MQAQNTSRKRSVPCTDPPCRPGKRCELHRNVARLQGAKYKLNDALKLLRDLDERGGLTDEDRLIVFDDLDRIREVLDALKAELRPTTNQDSPQPEASNPGEQEEP